MTVYVVQQQHRFDKDRQELVPKFDLSPAEKFGELDFLLSPTAAPWNPPSVLRDLHEKLCHYRDEDLLLLVGNPVLIGWAVAVAAEHNDGFVRCLQWSGRDRDYVEVEAQIW